MNYLPSEHQVLILSFQIIVMCISIIDMLQSKIFLDIMYMGMVGVEAKLSTKDTRFQNICYSQYGCNALRKFILLNQFLSKFRF